MTRLALWNTDRALKHASRLRNRLKQLGSYTKLNQRTKISKEQSSYLGSQRHTVHRDLNRRRRRSVLGGKVFRRSGGGLCLFPGGGVPAVCNDPVRPSRPETNNGTRFDCGD